MTNRPVPGGYKDRRLLIEAIRLNEVMVQPIRKLLVDSGGRLSQVQVLALLAQLGVLLTQQAHALREMESIRRGGDGETCGRSRDDDGVD